MGQKHDELLDWRESEDAAAFYFPWTRQQAAPVVTPLLLSGLSSPEQELQRATRLLVPDATSEVLISKKAHALGNAAVKLKGTFLLRVHSCSNHLQSVLATLLLMAAQVSVEETELLTHGAPLWAVSQSPSSRSIKPATQTIGVWAGLISCKGCVGRRQVEMYIGDPDPVTIRRGNSSALQIGEVPPSRALPEER
ncbi:hypothetical protein Bbelb_256580 [Branchiostoma belcheri]|nr:hypothetical protein Bbelb_256580 [Branchiostoma belcheri]